ncbi:hypothetical protein IV203_026253 [Nitzschia inconspicua]|uniref:Uncharacterized protein n=1 Tax=Nitzschia inconspicua TaxID=303405 RepID=A0A9K3PX21_9STRA|nr:hypothetical protein IV203_026253 [Nitzschia inconspicua]
MRIFHTFLDGSCIVLWLLSSSASAFSSYRSRSWQVSSSQRNSSLLTHPELFHHFSFHRNGIISTKLLVSNRRDTPEDGNSADRNSMTLRWKHLVSSLSTSFRSTRHWLEFGIAGIVLHKRSKTTHEKSLENATPSEEVTTTATSQSSEIALPKGPRWAISHPNIDLSGTWKAIITKDFLKKYDEYLVNCGASYIFRQVCLKFCSMTRETITQLDHGRILELDGQTPAGSWKRSLISSGAEAGSCDYNVEYTHFLDPDKEMVQVEAWWEDQGSVHKSILRNKPTVAGGEFETLRYLRKDASGTSAAKTFVTESTFRPKSSSTVSKFKPAHIQWEYTRVSSSL